MLRALEDHQRSLTEERDLLRFSPEINAETRRLVDWLKSGEVEVRRLEGRFLHGKAFLVGERSHGVLAGSSNFTRAGLTTNVELNLGSYAPHTVGRVSEWFDELWAEAADYDLAALYESLFEPYPPQLIYLRMLWERYSAELAEEAENDPTGAKRIHLTSFQRDGLWRAFRSQHNLPMELVSYEDDGRFPPQPAGGTHRAARLHHRRSRNRGHRRHPGTTDVLAEGVNLQQARHIINYDLPWNPMRLVQRISCARTRPPMSRKTRSTGRSTASTHPYPERTVRTVRIAVAASPDPAEQADRILSVIQDLGLQPHTPPDALPEITPEDVHLICWLAIT